MSDSIEPKLRQLPYRALTAVAARCARRSLLLTGSFPASARRTLESAVEIAEDYCRGNDRPDDAYLRIMQQLAEVKNEHAGANSVYRAAVDTVMSAVTTAVGGKMDSQSKAVEASKTAVLASRAAFQRATGSISAQELASAAGAESAELLPTFLRVTAELSALTGFDNDLDRVGGLGLGQGGQRGETVDPSKGGPLGDLWPISVSVEPSTKTAPTGSTQPRREQAASPNKGCAGAVLLMLLIVSLLSLALV